jgi:hypothetical protein
MPGLKNKKTLPQKQKKEAHTTSEDQDLSQ